MPDIDEHWDDEEPADQDDAVDEAVRRVVVAAMSSSMMKRFGAAAAMLIAGRRGSDMNPPEPIIEVGFEPDENDMPTLVRAAEAAGRDLIHVACHPDGSGKPTGMIATVLLEDGRAHAHRRGGLVCDPSGTDVMLCGVSDKEDEPFRFVLRPGGKMFRIPLELDAADLGAWMQRGGELWFERAGMVDLADCDDERLRVFELLNPNDERIRRVPDGGDRGVGDKPDAAS